MQVLVLENVRFYKEETKNDAEFAKKVRLVQQVVPKDVGGQGIPWSPVCGFTAQFRLDHFSTAQARLSAAFKSKVVWGLRTAVLHHPSIAMLDDVSPRISMSLQSASLSVTCHWQPSPLQARHKLSHMEHVDSASCLLSKQMRDV